MVEVQIGNEWRPIVKPIWPNDGYDQRGESPFAITPVIARHYGLFSVLADVRNRTGRGYVTHIVDEVEGHRVEYDYDTDDGGHDPLAYIAEPKGVPEDANEAWQKFTSLPKFHDMTWLTLAELEAGPWDQVLYEQGVAYEDEYLAWKNEGIQPRMHARSVGGPGLRIVNEVEYAAGERGETQTAVDFRWTGKTVREDVSPGFWVIVEVMRILCPSQDKDRIRLLLAFDS